MEVVYHCEISQSPLVSSVVFTSSPLVSSVVFTSSPLVSSVVLANNVEIKVVKATDIEVEKAIRDGLIEKGTDRWFTKLHSKRVEKM